MENWAALIATSIIATAIISLIILENLFFVTNTPTQETNQTPPSLNLSVQQFPLINIKLSPGKGKQEFNLGKTEIDHPLTVRFRPRLVKVVGDAGFALSAELRLSKKEKEYLIHMPCFAVKNNECYRIMSLIPGFDVPLEIEDGVYNASLIVSWKSKGNAEVVIELYYETNNELQPAKPSIIIQPVEGRPESTEDWVILPGSTRSYAVLVDKTKATINSDGYAEFTIFAWVFSPGAKKPPIVKVEIQGENINKSLEMELARRGIYVEGTLKVKVTAGTYNLTVWLGKTTFKTTLKAVQNNLDGENGT